MAGDIKSYIVNYDIRANVQDAVNVFKNMATAAKKILPDVENVAKAVNTLSSAMASLRTNAQEFIFKPQVDISLFNEQLKVMERSVMASAKIMREAIYGALQNTAVDPKKTMLRAARTAMQGDIARWKSEIEDLQKSLKKINDPLASKKNMAASTKKRLETERDAKKAEIQRQIDERKAAIARAEKEYKDQVKQEKKLAGTMQRSQKAVTPKGQNVNVTPATIRAWANAFGPNSRVKSLTVHIRGKADGPNGALTLINHVKTGLQELQGLTNLTIIPTLNQAAFATTEKQLRRLASLSAAITAPFVAQDSKKTNLKPGQKQKLTANEKQRLAEAQQRIGAWQQRMLAINEKIKEAQAKAAANPAKNMKGVITRNQNALRQVVEAYKADPQVQQDLKTIGALTRPVPKPTGKIPKATGTADIAGTLVSVKSASGKVFEVPVVGVVSKLVPPKKSLEIPANVKVATSQINTAIKSMARPTLPINVKLMWEKGAVGKQAQLKGLTDKIPPIKLVLDDSAAISKLEAFIAKIKASSPQNIALTAGGATTPPPAASTTLNSSTTGGATGNTSNTKATTGKQLLRARRNADIQRLTARASNIMLPFASNASQLKDLVKYRNFFKQAFKNTGIMGSPFDMNDYGRLKVLQETVALMQRNGVAVPMSFMRQIDAYDKSLTKAWNDQQKAREAAKAQRIATSNYNRMAPIAQNSSQLKLLTQYRRFFEWGAARSGYNLRAGANPFDNARYLNQVAALMKQEGVSVPWALQSQINKLNAGGSRGVAMPATRTPKKLPFDARARKWAYPFTGPTSFGVRTPMAVDMAKGMGVMFAIGGAMSAISNSFSQAMDYQNTMETTRAILKTGTGSYSTDNFTNMERIVREVGVKTKFSAPEVASAAKFLAMAGFDIESINNAIRPIADLALIGDYDLGETADKMTNIMTTFGVTPEKLKAQPQIMRQMGNVMNAVATRSNTDVMMLAESAKYGGGVAKMYGGDDPNIFADTMAIFGVMGNAGIQGSSAGTALRMMYQNIFNPNKNQKVILDMLENTFGVKRFQADGSKRSMADILMDMSNLIPKKQQADIISKLFRITAQPGANAAINAAANASSLGALITEEGTNAEEVVKGYNSLLDNIDKNGLGSLASLMLAARQSVLGDALGANAEAKQNTISGLWAQVTSTFTEGIVQAFEQRKGGFEEMLKSLRDWFANPETITTLQHLLDLIIEIGKIMASFVGIWVKLYSTAPGVIKAWVTTQMFFTQLGSLMMPLTAMLSVFGKFKDISAKTGGFLSLGGLFGGGGAGKAVRATVVGGASSGAAPILVDGVAGASMSSTVGSALGAGASGAAAAGGSSIASAAATGAAMAASSRRINVRPHSGAVWARAAKQYNTSMWRMGVDRMKRSYLSGAAMLMPSLTMSATGVKGLFLNLMSGLAKGIGLLVNPVTMTLAAIGGLAWGLTKLYKVSKGLTDAQIATQNKAKQAVAATKYELTQISKWQQDLVEQNIPKLDVTTPTSSINEKQVEEYNKAHDEFLKRYSSIFMPLEEGASDKATTMVADDFANLILSSHNRFGFTSAELESLRNGDLTNWSSKAGHIDMTPNNMSYGVAIANLYNKITSQKNNAIETQQNMIPLAIKLEGINSAETQQALLDIYAQYQRYRAGEIAEGQFLMLAKAIRERVANLSGRTFQPDGMTKEDFEREREFLPNYALYGEAIWEHLNNNLNFAYGSFLGTRKAYDDLLQLNRYRELQQLQDSNKLSPTQLKELEEIKKTVLISGSENWQKAIGQYISVQDLTYQVWDATQSKLISIKANLPTLETGKIDVPALLQQIQSNVEGGILAVQSFIDGMAAIFKAMVSSGLMTVEEARQQMYDNAADLPVSEKSATRFFNSLPENSPLKQEFKTAKVFINKGLNSGMGSFYESLIKQHSIEEQMRNLNPLVDTIKNNANNNIFAGKSNQPKSSGNDQIAYASSYDRSAAKPTHVTNNFTVNFDRTMIASNADEREMMAEIENRMAGVMAMVMAKTAEQVQESASA